MFEVRRFSPEDTDRWDAFVDNARNATFLFQRGYMGYHADRFADHSLMLTHNGKLVALLPASLKGNTLHSHGGLTYGGLLYGNKFSTENAIDAFTAINAFLKSEGIGRVVYKPTPWIYHRLPAEEDLYAISLVCEARLTVREVSSTIYLPTPPKFAQSRKGGVNKARRMGFTIRETDDIHTFWQILDTNLERKYGVSPVHTCDELQLLRSRFPQNIRLFMVYNGNNALGGTLIFDMGNTIHTQYISATPEGKLTGALDLLFDELIHTTFASRRFLDFGKSTEQNGSILNRNLIFQKEGFGGRALCYDTYTWDIT